VGDKGHVRWGIPGRVDKEFEYLYFLIEFRQFFRFLIKKISK
jgi:hypothetical protein